MKPITVTIHQTGIAMCSLSGKETDGLSVTFDDGTVTEQHLSWKSFRQLVAMKTAPNSTKASAKPMPTTGPAATMTVPGGPAGK